MQVMFFQKRSVDMKNTGLWVAVIIILLILNGAVLVWNALSKPNPRELREHKEGKPDTVTVVKTDTVTVVKRVQEKVFVPFEKIIRYGADSSRIDTSIVMKDSIRVHFAGTTFPAIDSLNFDISVEAPLREILREVTNTIKQTDTLKTKEVLEVPAPWYDHFWVGAVTVITVILSVVGFL